MGDWRQRCGAGSRVRGSEPQTRYSSRPRTRDFRRYLAVLVVLNSTPAFATDVYTFDTAGAPWTRAGSPAESCAAYVNWLVEVETRRFAGTGACLAFRNLGVDSNGTFCRYAGFESFGIPADACPPALFPDHPYYQVSVSINRRAIAQEEKGRGKPPGVCPVGNPCDPSTGNKLQEETDYVASGPFPLRFVRTYNWLSQAVTANLGGGWRHNYDARLVANAAGDAVGAFRTDGRVVKYERVGANWVSDADVTDRLQSVTGGGWKLFAGEGDQVESYDATGKLLAIENRAGSKHTLSYFVGGPNAGALAQVADHFGRTLGFTYTPQNYLASVTDPAGNVIRFGYDENLRLAEVTYPNSTPDVAADAPKRVYLYQDAAGITALTGVRDENGGQFATFVYEGGRLIETRHAGDADRFRLDYTGPSTTEVKSYTTSSDPVVRSYAFETILGVKYNTSVTGAPCPACGPQKQTFDPANGFRTSATDWNGNITRYAHDARGLETLRVEAAGTAEERRIATDWHAFYRLPTRVAEPLRITINEYGGPTDPNPGNRGALLSRSVQDTADASGAQGFSATPVGEPRVWRYTYDANGKIRAADGPRTDVADITAYTYYPDDDPDPGKRANLATITNAAGHLTQFSAYDAHGKPTTIVDPNGLVTTLAYDARQRLTARSVGGETTSYQYDGVGQVTKVTLPDGSFLAYTYDAAHRLIGVADSLGNRISYTLDLVGNRIREDVFDPGNTLVQTRSRVYSNLNRLEQQIGGTNPAVHITRFTYDDQGNLTSIDGPLTGSPNDLTVHAYDALNRLRQVTDALSGITQYGYDALDRISSVTDPRKLTTTYTVSGHGEQSLEVSPDRGTTRRVHDNAGNVVSMTDGRGQTINYRYDALNRPIGGFLATARYLEYDGGALQQPNAKGRLTNAQGGGGSTSYRYEPQGRVIEKVQVAGNVTRKVSYGYDGFGRMTSITYPSGKVVTLTHDPAGQVQSIAVGNVTILANAKWFPFGPVKSFVWGNGTPYARAFDLDGRLTTFPAGASTRSIAYDATGRIEVITDSATPNLNVVAGYDVLDRLTSYSGFPAAQAYSYDANGNRTSVGFGGGSPYAYSVAGASNRISAVAGPGPARNYSHDGAGNVTDDGARRFTYDPDGRLRGATIGTTGPSFAYDAFGQRVRKGPFAKGNYVYDESGRLIGEYDTWQQLIPQEYVYLGDQPVAILRGPTAAPEVLYIYADHLNTPRVVTDNANRERWRWDSAPFGDIMPNQDPSGLGVFELNLRFPGQYFDAETGLFYNNFRDYDSQTGRYVQSDPIGVIGLLERSLLTPSTRREGSRAVISPERTSNLRIGGATIESEQREVKRTLNLNLYGYADQNPVTVIDPTGEFPIHFGGQPSDSEFASYAEGDNVCFVPPRRPGGGGLPCLLREKVGRICTYTCMDGGSHVIILPGSKWAACPPIVYK